MNKTFEIIEKLDKTHSLSLDEYKLLIDEFSAETSAFLAEKAITARKKIYGNRIFIRGLIEISNICKNDCLYCGIRRSNSSCERYRLTAEQILECCNDGYSLGFRTFVLQGGEDPHFDDNTVSEIIKEIKTRYPDCAVTLSLGEKSKASYRRLYEAGADRYLLRHETADMAHYDMLHPGEMSFVFRMKCLENLREIGYQVGCGFMVGSPYQTAENLAADLKFIEEFNPDMCGIGPFIPHCATPFAEHKAGSVELTCYLLSIIRLIKPNILLPATTALGSLSENGREKGILAGANVIMPNLSPISERKKYSLYNNKLSTGNESAQEIKSLAESMEQIGYEIVCDRGDIIK